MSFDSNMEVLTLEPTINVLVVSLLQIWRGQHRVGQRARQDGGGCRGARGCGRTRLESLPVAKKRGSMSQILCEEVNVKWL